MVYQDGPRSLLVRHGFRINKAKRQNTVFKIDKRLELTCLYCFDTALLSDGNATRLGNSPESPHIMTAERVALHFPEEAVHKLAN
jgi:hypothetical protein